MYTREELKQIWFNKMKLDLDTLDNVQLKAYKIGEYAFIIGYYTGVEQYSV